VKALPVFGCAGLSPFHIPAFLSRSTTTKGITTFFAFLAASIVGAGAMKLGALSVTVSILSIALQAVLFANVMGAAYLAWRKYQEINAQ